ncbi:MAG: acetolactate synthase large subunit [Desulfobacteraceae bacterium 4572_88]|nr:MAG: acetolactate synthase large subunit [Desulfobacteraceae bacterium 4572_88]
MKKSGAYLCVYALEQLPVTHTFGIPGLQSTEIYDELNNSQKIRPVLVTHEGGGAFMADAISRTTQTIGTLVIVPSAGVTHAMSGIGEAFLDGIPMLIISGGTRRDIDKSYQLHQWDQHRVLAGVTKKTFLIREHQEIVPTIFEAYQIATSGEPGPVFVEIPVEIQMYLGEVDELPTFQPKESDPAIKNADIQDALALLKNSSAPGMFLGWGCRDYTELAIELAELLEAPVATTLQGLSVFPATHPLHVGMGFGPSAVPAAENAFKDCDCLLAMGTRFGEIPTGSFGVSVPENLIHSDINAEVFNKNFPAKVCIEGDAGDVLSALLAALKKDGFQSNRSKETLRDQILKDKSDYQKEWKKSRKDRVNPALFFEMLRAKLADDAITVVDDGNHTFLAAELFPVYRSRHFISPTDFNCMGYCVPGAIGAKLTNPEKQVVGIVGDGAFLMTCMEILTASSYSAGVVYFVFYDGELSMISQGQEIPYNRKTCSVLGDIRLEGVAQATGAAFLRICKNEETDSVITEALEIATKGRPVIVDVKVDYSKRTRFTKGVVKTVLKRFPLGDKIRFIGRAVMRKVTG